MRLLESVAARCGWALGEVFVDDDPGRPLTAFTHLRAACREGGDPVAVLVVSASEFSPSVDTFGGQGRELPAVFERDSGVPVVEAVRLGMSRGGPLLDPGNGLTATPLADAIHPGWAQVMADDHRAWREVEALAGRVW